MRTDTPYDDAYATCAKTFAWLRVMSEQLQPEAVTGLLGVKPTHTQVRGDLPRPSSKHPFRYSGWFLQSSQAVSSLDARRHLDWVLGQLHGKANAISELKAQGHLVDLCIRWDSLGQGGPTLDPKHLAQLGELGIQLWFDIYFAGEADAG